MERRGHDRKQILPQRQKLRRMIAGHLLSDRIRQQLISVKFRIYRIVIFQICLQLCADVLSEEFVKLRISSLCALDVEFILLTVSLLHCLRRRRDDSLVLLVHTIDQSPYLDIVQPDQIGIVLRKYSVECKIPNRYVSVDVAQDRPLDSPCERIRAVQCPAGIYNQRLAVVDHLVYNPMPEQAGCLVLVRRDIEQIVIIRRPVRFPISVRPDLRMANRVTDQGCRRIDCQ